LNDLHTDTHRLPESRHLRALATVVSAAALLLAGCGDRRPAQTIDAPSTAPPATAAAERPTKALPRAAPQPTGRHADFRHAHLSRDAREIAEWAVASGDNRGLPFILVDKLRATVIAFDAQGRLQRSTPALLGAARGDDSVPGIGERKIADIRPEERTTPAGRFEAEMGVNANGEDILWVDYEDAISMHRVRATNPVERRLQRLASPTIKDNRISYGCINLPAAFYDEVVKPLFAPRNGIVYVLPETRPVRSVFGAYDVAQLGAAHHAR